VESTIRFQNRTSTVFEGFISPSAVGGDTPEEIARAVALRTERATGTSGRTPGFMDKRFGELIHNGDALTPKGGTLHSACRRARTSTWQRWDRQAAADDDEDDD
jgi:hypothetical protein